MNEFDIHTLLLDNDAVRQISVHLAELIGIHEAHFIHQLHYWMEINRKAGKTDHYFDGRWWAYNSYAMWVEFDFPWLTERGLRGIVAGLVDVGYVLSKPRYISGVQRGNWWSVDHAAIAKLMTDNPIKIRVPKNGVSKKDTQPTEEGVIKGQHQRDTLQRNTKTLFADKPQSEQIPKPKRERKPQPRDLVSDAIAMGAYGKAKGTTITSLAAHMVIEQKFGAIKPGGADCQALADELALAYAEWPRIHPGFNPPAKGESVCAMLRNYRNRGQATDDAEFLRLNDTSRFVEPERPYQPPRRVKS
jgi:hypothetical protein